MTTPAFKKPLTGIALSGGGARGAYQAGVLKGLIEISLGVGVRNPFPIITGVSAGAINAGALAAGADDVQAGIIKLCSIWENVEPHLVFKTDTATFFKTGINWLNQLSPSPVKKKNFANSLLDTEPLGKLLRRTIPCARIQENIDRGFLKGVAISAIDYSSFNSVTFVQSDDSIEMWERIRRYSKREKITIEHIMASAAIPIFFPSVTIKGNYFGDGCLRNNAPVSPAIHLGASKIFVVGVRKQGNISDQYFSAHQKPTIARISSTLLNSVFLDGTEFDIERLNRINQTLLAAGEEGRKVNPLKLIDFILIQPSQDIGAIALKHSDKLATSIKFLLSRLGSKEDGAEIMSYLLFNSEYCTELLNLGYHDALSQKKQIEDFLLDERD